MVIPSELIIDSIAVDVIWNCIYEINYHKYYQNLWVLKTTHCILSFTPERKCLEIFPQETKFPPNFLILEVSRMWLAEELVCSKAELNPVYFMTGLPP